MQGCFSYGIVPCKDKAEKDELIEKLKKKDKEEEEKRDKERYRISKFLDKIKTKKEKKYELEVNPRSLDEIISLKDIDLKVKKGELVIIVGKI